LLDSVEALPVDWEAAIATADLFTRSILMGIDHALPTSHNFAEDIPVEVLSFEEAVKYMRSRLPLSAREYYELDDKMRYRAFAVSRLADADAVAQVKKYLQKSLDEGGTLDDFRKFTNEELLDATGLGQTAGWYWETVYRTNVQTAYNVGRAIGFDSAHPIALELIGVNDLRQTEFCRSVTDPPFRRPYGDTVWETMWPPFHFNCRTTVRGIYDQEEIDGEGGPDRFYTIAGQDAPEPGWGSNPLDGSDWWEMTPAMKKRAKKAKIDKEIKKAREVLVEQPKKLEYRESRTIAEANKFARNDLGLTGSSYSGCHVEAANEWNRSLVKNLNQFPEVQGLRYVGSFADAKKKYTAARTETLLEKLKADYPGFSEETLRKSAKKMARKAAEQTYVSSAHGLMYYGDIDEIKGIALNDRLASNPEWHRMLRKREVNNRYKVIGGDSIGAIADHEFGHVLDNWLDISDNSDVQRIFSKLKADDGVELLSGYGTSNIHEMIAESWAEWRNNPVPRETATSVAEIILRRYAEWKKQNS